MSSRRQFISLLGGAAAAWPMAARGQQAGMPVIGFLYAGSSGPGVFESSDAAYRHALAETGFVDGQNVAIDYRYAEGNYDRLAKLVADLVRRQVSVIVATPNLNSARAAKAATAVIPILFMVGDDPSKLGLVASLNRPGGNATGVNYFLSELVPKRFGLLRELVPTTTRVGVLANPSAASTSLRESVIAASDLGFRVEIVQARNSHELETAFATLAGNAIRALVVLPDTFFANQRAHIVTLAAHYAIPAIYTVRQYVDAGGLISYGPNLIEPYRQLGIYTGRILKGAKPADLPVVQSTKFEMVINIKTAKTLGLNIPPTLLAIANEAIE